MANLTKEQLDFLARHNIPINQVFDATNMSPSEYQALMKVKSHIIAFGVTPCTEVGHTLRTRGGHCAQCDPARIAFIKRHENIGYIYIAGSISLRAIKVGVTCRTAERAKTLRHTKYGNANDWELLCEYECTEAGMIEQKITTLLNPYSISKSYFHDRHSQETYELFGCSYDKAFMCLTDIKVQFPMNFHSELVKKHKISNYQFSNLRSIVSK
jgi:hypothetical protein